MNQPLTSPFKKFDHAALMQYEFSFLSLQVSLSQLSPSKASPQSHSMSPSKFAVHGWPLQSAATTQITVDRKTVEQMLTLLYAYIAKFTRNENFLNKKSCITVETNKIIRWQWRIANSECLAYLHRCSLHPSSRRHKHTWSHCPLFGTSRRCCNLHSSGRRL